MSDDAKKAILARRAKFVAAAVVGLGTASCDSCYPKPCLSVAYVGDAAPPRVCLSPPVMTVDAGASVQDATIGPPTADAAAARADAAKAPDGSAR